MNELVMNPAAIEPKLATLGELKAALKTAKAVYVWVAWEPDDGSYVQVTKAAFLRGIGADTPWDESGHGGRHDATAVSAVLRADGVYIN